MSTINSILGIPGLVVQSVTRAQDIHVWARPRRRPACLYCAEQPVRIKTTHERTLKHTRQGKQLVELAIGAPGQEVVAQAIDRACHGTHDPIGVSSGINWKMETGEIGCSRDRVKRSPIRGW